MRAILLGVGFVAAFAGILAAGTTVQAQPPQPRPVVRPGEDHPGRAVYNRSCAMCHERSQETRAPALVALRQLDAAHIRHALMEGAMQAQGRALTQQDLAQVIEYLADPAVGQHDWIDANTCSNDRRAVDLSMPATVATFGFGLDSKRRMTASEAGLASGDLERLELEWAIGFPQTSTMRSQPVVVGSTLFISVGDTSRVYALDTDTGCVKWTYVSETPLRTALTYGEVGPDRRKVLLVGDVTRRLLQLDAETGRLIWEQDVRLFDRSRPSAAPLIYDGKVLMAMSNREASQAPNDNFECCRTHGGVVALDAVTGKRLWVYHTMEGAIIQGVNAVGVTRWGPSGAPIWANPTIDVKRNQLLVTTGENFSLPATGTSDAIIAIDIATGREKWVFQGTARDAWNSACGTDHSGANCPPETESIREDFDFGGAAVVAQTSSGKDIILAGQKSGHIWAVDPDTGKLIWSQRFGRGTTLGGNHMGIAVDDTRVFVPINDSVRPNRIGSNEPGMNALDITTGKVLWRWRAMPDCGGGRKARAPRCEIWYGLSSPPLVIDKSLIASSVDGKILIFDAATGRITWQYDTLRDFKTVNGVAGKGGQIDNGAFLAARGALYVQSGYGGEPGNVLLKFKPKQR